jgi:hypothetical protein
VTSIDHHNSLFVDKMNMEILDLSGNRDMENLPASLSMAKKTPDAFVGCGCDGLARECCCARGASLFLKAI